MNPDINYSGYNFLDYVKQVKYYGNNSYILEALLNEAKYHLTSNKYQALRLYIFKNTDVQKWIQIGSLLTKRK